MSSLAAVGRTDWFVTATGRTCYVLAPELSDYTIDDIQLGLSRLCRFGGQVAESVPFYSVAQHSVHVSRLVPAPFAPAAFGHDWSEAFLGDVIRPVKKILAPLYKPIEQAWLLDMGMRFGLGVALADESPVVKTADNVALATERRDLVHGGPRPWTARASADPHRIEPLRPEAAAALFMERFHELFEPDPARGGAYRPRGLSERVRVSDGWVT